MVAHTVDAVGGVEPGLARLDIDDQPGWADQQVRPDAWLRREPDPH